MQTWALCLLKKITIFYSAQCRYGQTLGNAIYSRIRGHGLKGYLLKGSSKVCFTWYKAQRRYRELKQVRHMRSFLKKETQYTEFTYISNNIHA